MKTGDIITSTASNNPFLLHKAIMLDDCTVCHNSPDFDYPVCENIADYYKAGRKVLWVTNSGLTTDEIKRKTDQLSANKFHLFLFNCEQYISEITRGNRFSFQLNVWGIIFFFLLLFVVWISKPFSK